MSRRARRWLGVLAVTVAVIASAAAVFVPYRPVRVVGAPAPRGPYRPVGSVPGLRLHVFNTGMNRMSSLLVGSTRPWRPAPAFVLEHPREGLVVFDCGLSPEVAREGEAALGAPMRWLFESRGKPGRTLDAQMLEAGLDPSLVRWVVISHLHVDHVGAAFAFPGATFVGGAGTAGHALPGGFTPSFREIAFEGDREPFPPFDASIDLFGDGSFRLLRGGGHAREDLMALIALPSGPALLTGDAVVHRDWLASDDVERVAVEPQRAGDVRDAVRAFIANTPELVVLFGHDLRGIPGGRGDLELHHPEWFGDDAWPIGPSGS
jgi:N-acyl homoserine lactone hydrolase